MSENKLPIYELLIQDETIDGITAMSLVDSPAIEMDFLTFAKQQKIEFKVTDKEQRLIIGPALVADKQIYRRDKMGNEFYVFFSTDTVKQIAHQFLLDGKQNNITLDHNVNGNGVKLVESWLSKQDNELGFETKKGDWFVAYKIDNDEIWNEVKEGNFNGFSIEVFTSLIETQLTEQSENDILEELDDIAIPQVINVDVSAEIQQQIDDFITEIESLTK